MLEVAIGQDILNKCLLYPKLIRQQNLQNIGVIKANLKLDLSKKLPAYQIAQVISKRFPSMEIFKTIKFLIEMPSHFGAHGIKYVFTRRWEEKVLNSGKFELQVNGYSRRYVKK